MYNSLYSMYMEQYAYWRLLSRKAFQRVNGRLSALTVNFVRICSDAVPYYLALVGPYSHCSLVPEKELLILLIMLLQAIKYAE